MTVDKVTGDVLVARDDGIYQYGLNGRGPVYAYEGQKRMISTFKDYVAVVSPPKTNAIRSPTLRAFGGNQTDDLFSTSSFTLLNTDLKFSAHQEALPSQIQTVFVEWGDLFVMTMDGKVSWLLRDKFRHLLIYKSCTATTRNRSNKSSSYSTSAICTFLPSTWPRKPGSRG